MRGMCTGCYTGNVIYLSTFSKILAPGLRLAWVVAPPQVIFRMAQAKHRRLFEALPELDGVCTFTADEQSYWGNYQTFDVMHAGDGCDWDLAKWHRTYIVKLWEVVAGEVYKVLVPPTWAGKNF